jgi:hypothetical protein
MPRPRWSDDDRQRHADRDILKARKVPSKRRDGPNADEWADECDTPVVDSEEINEPGSA